MLVKTLTELTETICGYLMKRIIEMKKMLLIVLCITILSGLVQAQELGIRFGDTVGNTVAIDGVLGWKKNNLPWSN